METNRWRPMKRLFTQHSLTSKNWLIIDKEYRSANRPKCPFSEWHSGSQQVAFPGMLASTFAWHIDSESVQRMCLLICEWASECTSECAREYANGWICQWTCLRICAAATRCQRTPVAIDTQANINQNNLRLLNRTRIATRIVATPTKRIWLPSRRLSLKINKFIDFQNRCKSDVEFANYQMHYLMHYKSPIWRCQ